MQSAEKRSLRESALLGQAAPLCDAGGAFGPAILPLNFWHVLLLLGYSNPFAVGGVFSVDAILQYLWFCSPECTRLHADVARPAHPAYARWRFFLFARRWRLAVSEYRRRPSGQWRRGPTQRAIAAVVAHFAVLRLDRPPVPREAKDAGKPAPVALDGPHELAGYELVCRQLLKYSRAEFWHTPCAHTNQLLSLALRARYGDEIPTFDGSEKAAGARLRARIAARAAALAAQPS